MSLLGDILGTSWEITPCPQPLDLPGSLPTLTCLTHKAIYPGSRGCALEVELTREVKWFSVLSPDCWVSLRRNKWWLFCKATQWAAFSLSRDLYPGRGRVHLSSLHLLERICGKQSKKALIVTKGLQKPLELFAQSPWLPGQWSMAVIQFYSGNGWFKVKK